MAVIQKIYDSEDLTKYADKILEKVDKAVLASAYAIRDAARSSFSSSTSLYKYHSGNLTKLSEGIMVGKLTNSKVKIHSLGSRDFYDSYKTRFYVGGTIPRTQTKRNGKSIKPYTKGYIRANNAIDIGLTSAGSTLNEYIQNVLDN